MIYRWCSLVAFQTSKRSARWCPLFLRWCEWMFPKIALVDTEPIGLDLKRNYCQLRLWFKVLIYQCPGTSWRCPPSWSICLCSTSLISHGHLLTLFPPMTVEYTHSPSDINRLSHQYLPVEMPLLCRFVTIWGDRVSDPRPYRLPSFPRPSRKLTSH